MASIRRSSRTTRRARAKIIPLFAVPRSTPIRWSKVLAAQRRIVAGHYERDDVKSSLVEAVLRELHRH
jgi:hypothetical protein